MTDANGQQATPATNAYAGIDPLKAREYVDRLEERHREIERVMAEARTTCKDFHADIKDILQEAKDTHGLSTRALKSVVRIRKLERQADKIRDEAIPEIQDTIDAIRHALGDLADLPLGAAALAQHEQQASA